jgi:hypothetical protein
MDAALNLRIARPLHRRSMRRFVVLVQCEFCGYKFDLDSLGRFGCPNCHGEGLDDAEPMDLLPCWRLSPSILPIVGRSSRASRGGDNLGGCVGGKGFCEAHKGTLHRKNKSAMPKIILAISRQCRHIARMTTTEAKKLGYTPWEKRERIGTRMGGLGNKLELAIIRSTWEIFETDKPFSDGPVITGAKTRKEALAMLAASLHNNQDRAFTK